MAFERKYTDEVRAASVAEVLRRRQAEPSNRSIIREVSEEYAVGYQSLRQWLARFDDGSYDFDDANGPASAERVSEPVDREQLQARIAELEQRIETLEEDNQSLTRVVALFADQLRLGTT